MRNDVEVTFAGTRTSKTHHAANAADRSVRVSTEKGRIHVMIVEDERHLLFYGSIPDPQPATMHPLNCVIANELREIDEGRILLIDGKQYRVAGFDGTARIVPKWV